MIELQGQTASKGSGTLNESEVVGPGAGDIGCEDRREPTFDASWPCDLHGASSVAVDPYTSRRSARIKHDVRDRPRSVNIVVLQSLGRADFVVPGASIRCFFGRPIAV